METLNDFESILNEVWQLMNIEFTIYGFTLSYGQVFAFTLMSTFAMRALYILWFD